VVAIAPDGDALAFGQRAVVLDDAFQRLPGQVEPVEIGIAMLQRRNDPERLRVVIEPAMGLQAGVKGTLAGMAERRMAEIMGQRQRFREVFVETQLRSGRLPASASAGCGSDRLRGTRKPGFYASTGGRR
jgi:hypothetical protein